MKKIRLDDEEYNGKSIRSSMLELWKKNYLNEAWKFIQATRLNADDLYKEFDYQGEKWKIMGNIDSRDMVCEKISTGEMFIWDRLKVSSIVKVDEHNMYKRKVEFIMPDKKATRKSKVEEVGQLNLFDSPPQVEPTTPSGKIYKQVEPNLFILSDPDTSETSNLPDTGTVTVTVTSDSNDAGTVHTETITVVVDKSPVIEEPTQEITDGTIA